ncbi:DUF1028 domain-containing protein [Fluviispira multicolorata]|uniref:DUF1028 domain-containing protein n=1 Tax=Fluviispira multicolorata TaxID=2654512 RepID=A0A833N4F9_9BACT|nr:DUF1028 domain-containing protein [Fluviispira multicolorata]KAB8030801.1 DUF1028 domain-containing protein [Fluviispira multicolorata]
MTFSIIANNNNKTEFTVAICLAIPFIEKYSTFIYPNICAVTAQGKIDPSTAYTVRNLLIDSIPDSDILTYLEKNDLSLHRKQHSFLNFKYQKFTAYTGNELKFNRNDYSEIIGKTIIDEDFVISGNCLVSLKTLYRMKENFLSYSHLDLDLRILEALKAGNNTLGDYRCRQSASLYYYKKTNEFPHRIIDVDEHTHSVEELERIFNYATSNWQNVVNYCFYDMNFNRKFKNKNDFPKEVKISVDKSSKPINDRKLILNLQRILPFP